MVDSTSTQQLKGDLSITDRSLIPTHMRNSNFLLANIQKAESISWENEGEKLLKKISLSKDDKKIAKLLIFKGIPYEKRGQFWFVAIGAKREMKDHPGYYAFLVKEYPKEVELPNERQIEIDLLRTFPEDPFFHDSNNIKKLRNILLSYSKRNLSIGYVQGFNFIVGRILKFVPDEEQAFWIFTQIIENILPINFYSEMAGLMIDVDILVCLFNQRYFPDLSSLMGESLFIYLKNILFQWFLSLFIVNFSYEASILIWDVLFVEKSVALFKAAISLVKLIKNQLAELTDLENLRNVLKDYFTNFNNVSYLKFCLVMKKFEFNSDFLELNRIFLENEIVSQINKSNSGKVKKLKDKITTRQDLCDVTWPFCIYDCESFYTVSTNLVLKTAVPVIIHEDYFFTNVKDTKEDQKDDYFLSLNFLDYENALIERKDHCCETSHQIKKQLTRLPTNEDQDDTMNVSTGTGDKSLERSYDQEKESCEITPEKSEHQIMKMTYKKLSKQLLNKILLGKKNRCISAIAFTDSSSEKKKPEKINNYEAFVSKINYQCKIQYFDQFSLDNMVSIAQSVFLKNVESNACVPNYETNNLFISNKL